MLYALEPVNRHFSNLNMEEEAKAKEEVGELGFTLGL